MRQFSGMSFGRQREKTLESLQANRPISQAMTSVLSWCFICGRKRERALEYDRPGIGKECVGRQ